VVAEEPRRALQWHLWHKNKELLEPCFVKTQTASLYLTFLIFLTFDLL
jgi:hypothetical protein